jgi:hypothetical protein
MPMFAGNLVVLALGLAAGCQRLSSARLPDLEPPPAPPSALKPLPGAVPASPAATPLVTGSAPASQVAPGPAPSAAAPETAPPPAPTPLLDAALTRAKGEEARLQLIAFEPEVGLGTLLGAVPGDEPAPMPSLPQPSQGRSFAERRTTLEADLAAEPTPKRDGNVEAAASLVPGKPTATATPAPARPIDPGWPSDPPAPADPWRDGLERLASVARDRAADTGGEARDLWTLRARVLGWLEEPANAAGPSHAGALWRSVLGWLTGPDPETPASIRTAVAALEDQMPFEITALQLCRKVRGFGDFELIDAIACRPGHSVIVYFEMTGVRYAPEGSRFHSRLQSRVEIRGAGGGEPVWTKVLGTVDDVCQRRRRDFYVNYRVILPESLAPGAYELRLVEDDLVGNQSATRTIALAIAP